jgi:membrane protein DedA with SNARE-associated domain/membrane-associated phospholipid phosphatase
MSGREGERAGRTDGRGAERAEGTGDPGGGGRRSHLLQLGIAAAVIVGFVVLTRVVPNIDLQQALKDVSEKLGALTYVLVAAAAFLETGAFVGLVLPGETVIILGGAVAGQGETSIVLTIGVIWVAAFLGDSTSFMLGRRLGRGFILRHGPKVRITHERFARVEDYFSRHGGKTILVGRFIGLVRAIAPFTAGSSGMRYTYYLPFCVLGTGLWAVAFALIGYFASQSLDAAAHAAGEGTFLFGTAVATIVVIVIIVRFLREAENRRRLVAGMERRAALRPLVGVARRLGPQARFVVDRLTPGGLGLEFTTLVAVLAVAVYVVVAYTGLVADDPGPTPGDRTAADLAADLQTPWLTDAANAVTQLGSSAVVLPLVLVAAVLLAARRRWTEAAVLVVAVAIIYGGVQGLKEATDRPRPPGSLTPSTGSGFPSGHAAHAIIYPWLALTLTVRLRPRVSGGSALLAAGVAVAVAVGLSRVYLGVHYLSDVSAGWALGVAAFAACAAVAMVVTHLRQNSHDGQLGDRD